MTLVLTAAFGFGFSLSLSRRLLRLRTHLVFKLARTCACVRAHAIARAYAHTHAILMRSISSFDLFNLDPFNPPLAFRCGFRRNLAVGFADRQMPRGKKGRRADPISSLTLASTCPFGAKITPPPPYGAVAEAERKKSERIERSLRLGFTGLCRRDGASVAKGHRTPIRAPVSARHCHRTTPNDNRRRSVRIDAGCRLASSDGNAGPRRGLEWASDALWLPTPHPDDKAP